MLRRSAGKNNCKIFATARRPSQTLSP